MRIHKKVQLHWSDFLKESPFYVKSLWICSDTEPKRKKDAIEHRTHQVLSNEHLNELSRTLHCYEKR